MRVTNKQSNINETRIKPNVNVHSRTHKKEEADNLKKRSRNIQLAKKDQGNTYHPSALTDVKS